MIFQSKDINTVFISKRIFVDSLKERRETMNFLNVLQKYTHSFIGDTKASFPSVYCKIEDFIAMVKCWWSELSLGRSVIHLSKAAYFLHQKGFLVSLNKCIKICSSFAADEQIDYISFENIFLKIIFIAQLINIKHGIDIQTIEAPMRMKMAIYQRKLLINGADPIGDNIERKNLNAIYSYNKKAEALDKSNRSIINENLLENAENAHKHKLKEIIYQADHYGIDFVAASGDMRKNIKAPWDLKHAISAKGEEQANISNDKDYFKILTSKNTEKKNTEKKNKPYKRNLKIFRDNFLFEKFQIVANKSPDISAPISKSPLIDNED